MVWLCGKYLEEAIWFFEGQLTPFYSSRGIFSAIDLKSKENEGNDNQDLIHLL